MSNTLCTFGANGIINVEIALLKTIPGFSIVGLGDKSIQEARERILAVIDLLNIKKPIGKIVVNLSPANTTKAGTHFDLPILLAFLTKCEFKIIVNLQEYLIIGELSLDGRILSVPQAFIAGLLATRHNRKIICSTDDMQFVSLAMNENIYAFETIFELIEYLKTGKYNDKPIAIAPLPCRTEHVITYCNDIEIMFMMIIAAGRHHGCMIGSPGVGKTTIASMLHDILPNLPFNESLEVMEIYEYAGIKRNNIYIPPFRNPHFTASTVSLIGSQLPGEISLAHRGVLFLDEVCEFSTEFLNSLRTPIQDSIVNIARANYKATYNANVILLIAANPCSCGYALESECRCKKTYLRKIQGPLLDRIDVTLYMRSKNIFQISRNMNITAIRDFIQKCYDIQLQRYNSYNGKILLSELIQKGKFEESAIECAKKICDYHKLSVRMYGNILSVGRTIADLGNSIYVTQHHIYVARCFLSEKLADYR